MKVLAALKAIGEAISRFLGFLHDRQVRKALKYEIEKNRRKRMKEAERIEEQVKADGFTDGQLDRMHKYQRE